MWAQTSLWDAYLYPLPLKTSSGQHYKRRHKWFLVCYLSIHSLWSAVSWDRSVQCVVLIKRPWQPLSGNPERDIWMIGVAPLLVITLSLIVKWLNWSVCFLHLCSTVNTLIVHLTHSYFYSRLTQLVRKYSKIIFYCDGTVKIWIYQSFWLKALHSLLKSR